MIRRNVTTENGQPGWLLISQVEHARLSGELAENWTQATPEATPSFLPLIDSEQLLPAVYHHDDGWEQWEQTPQVDSQTGRPLAFTEMPLEVALDIWRKSIDRAKEIGPLAAWVVAGHFTVLLSKSHEAQKPAATAWLSEYDFLRKEWLEAWERMNPTSNARQLAEVALHQLQLFDFLSLWLCLAERTSPQVFDTPGGTPLTLTPQPNREFISLHPWPLAKDELELSIAGRLVPARAYPDSEALAAVASVPQKLTWRFVRA